TAGGDASRTSVSRRALDLVEHEFGCGTRRRTAVQESWRVRCASTHHACRCSQVCGGTPMISYLSDMDGVLIKEGEMIPGADKFIQSLRDNDIIFMVLTNN